MVNWGELVIVAAVVVEKFERRIAVGAKKDRRRPRMSGVQWTRICVVARGGDRQSRREVREIGIHVRIRWSPIEVQVSGRRWNESQVPVVSTVRPR